jgi:two-component system heavy metal sensor histidine kinase CusS
MSIERGGRRPWSLALRITLVVSLTMGAVFALSAWFVSRSIEAHFEELDFDELQAVIGSVAEALGDAPQREDPDVLQARLARAVAGHHGVSFAVFGSAAAAIHASAPQPLVDAARASATAAALRRETLQDWALGAETYRGAVVAVAGLRVLVALGTEVHEHYLTELRRGLSLGALAATLLAVLAVGIAVRWGHAPIRRMSQTVRGITSEQLHVRLDPAAVPGELSALVASFNTMLDRLQASFERLSHFSADIAHELRTPVTNLMTQTQVALAKERPASAYREVLYTGLEELDRLRRMIGDMLFLAQAENPSHKLAREDVDLDAEVGAVFEFYEAWSEDAGVRLRFESEPGQSQRLRADRGMLQRALGNLVGNALRHTARGQTVTLRAMDEPQSLRIEVENPGPPIAPEHLAYLFDRFYRIDPARRRAGEGAGLGLAIVKAIAEAHGGAVGVSSEGGSNRFWLRIPLV